MELSKAQRLKIAEFMERSLEPHVQRVDENSVQIVAETAASYAISYTLLESGGCSGPGRISNQTGTVPVSLLD